MKKRLLTFLGKTPWVARQALKAAAWAQGTAAGLLSQAKVGDTDLLTTDQETTIALAVGAIVTATIEGVLSYAVKSSQDAS